MEDLVAMKSDDAFKEMLPDAVSCVVILDIPGEEPRLLFSHEFRYPAGRFLLSIPAGLRAGVIIPWLRGQHCCILYRICESKS